MGKIADQTAVHFRLLNASKGTGRSILPFSMRQQLYRLAMKAVVEKEKRLHLRQGLVNRLIVEDKKIVGVEDQTGIFYGGKTVIITTGTFLNGLIHIGTTSYPAGRAGEMASIELAESLRAQELRGMGRMKYRRTPPRLRASSINFSVLERQDSDPDPEPFSFKTEKLRDERLPSYFSYTTAETHRLIGENIRLSPSIPAPSRASVPVTARRWKIRSCALLIRRGIRSCWSSKGWIRRRYTPRDWATACRRSFRKRSFTVFPALNKRRSCGRPMPSSMISSNLTQLRQSLETKRYQVYIWQAKSMGPPVMKKPPHRGWAGINAALAGKGRPSFILDRSDAYMGVMVDDLVTRGVDEPYRMFTFKGGVPLDPSGRQCGRSV